MKRFALIAAAVLVPFCAFVAWGLAALREPVVAPAAATEAAPAVAVAPVVQAAPVPPAAAGVAAPAPVALAAPAPRAALTPAVAPAVPAAVPALEAEEAPVADDPKVLAAVVEQLDPQVRRCGREARELPRRESRILVAFQVKPDGTLSDVQMRGSARAPGLTTCLEQALAAARLDPARGIPRAPMRHAFAFKGR